MGVTVGVDVGGTFTDVVTMAGTAPTGRKVPTTPDQSQAVAEALAQSGLGADSVFLHGTTVGTNALLEGRGARVALVTTTGFEDVIEIGRQARTSLYDPLADRPPPLVERDLRFGYDGDYEALRRDLVVSRPEAVAVALVRSFRDPGEELEIARRLREELGVPVSAGAMVSPPFREYERVATTVLNVYLATEVAGYLSRLESAVGAARRLVMTSSGGLIPFDVAVDYSGRLVLSGPAAGAIAAAEMGRAKGHRSVISFDMGGTSTDVCRIDDGRATSDMRISGAGWVNRVPALPVRTIGAGGGSIAWIDDGGALRVGPRSAGASPGPACYGKGGVDPTVTDANLVLGRIPSDLLLGGTLGLDRSAAARSISGLGSRLGLGVDTVASGIVEVVDSHMERALRSVSVEEGVDPRQSVLVAFGGAGGLHASRLAARLGIPRTLIPPLSGVFSALGLLLARPGTDVSRTVLLDEGDPALWNQVAALVESVRSAFNRDHGGSTPRVTTTAEMRYHGQSHELPVVVERGWDALRAAFDDQHLARFGFSRPDQGVEVVNLKAVAEGSPPLTWSDLPPVGVARAPEPRFGSCLVGDRSMEIPVYDRVELPSGFEVSGPALVTETDSAIWLEPSDLLAVHDDGALEITCR